LGLAVKLAKSTGTSGSRSYAAPEQKKNSKVRKKKERERI